MDSAEFTEWQAFYLIEPFGDEVADRRHGSAMALQANAQRGPNTEPFKAEDFMYGATAQSAAGDDEPVLLEDDVAQADLILTEVFRLPPRERTK
jgi:hypothetical protein